MAQEFATRLDSRELVDRFDELVDIEPLDTEAQEEYGELKRVIEELRENCEEEPENGIVMVLEKDWVLYVEELIDDCGENPKAGLSDSWPYNHLTFDYEAAAEELKSDWAEIKYKGETYICR